MTDSTSTSSFNFEDESPSSDNRFSDFQVLSSRGYSLLVKAQRNGKWFMLKGLKEEYRKVKVYADALHKEYDILSALQHPNIISVESLEDVEGLGECIVEEYASGRNLREALEEGLSSESKQQILREILDAVEYIHKKQIVHRDLKPSNIMVSEDGNHVKIIDFGLSDSDSYTFLKQPSGTESFMSPEQKTSLEADTRNDIYSLGCIVECMEMGKKYSPVIRRCKKPIAERYQSVEEMRKDILRREQPSPVKWIAAGFLLLVALVAIGLRYHWSEEIYSWAKSVHLTNYDFCEDGIYYNILSREELTVEVTNNGSTNTYAGDYTIPEYVEHGGKKYRVVRIGNEAFYLCDSLIAVVLPQSIHSIGKSAFLQAGLLATINIPDAVTEMGDSAFRDSKKLRSVHFPQSMNIVPRYCFSGCSALRTLYLHEGITAIERDALAECAFDSINFPHSLRSIERGAFWYCWRMKKLTLPASIERFGDYVFWGCDSVTDVYVERQEPLVITNIFQDLKNIRLHVPKGSGEAYKKATGWNSLEVVENH